MADPELVTYLRKHVPLYGAKSLRAQLIKDGVKPGDVDEALAEAHAGGKRRGMGMMAVLGGCILLITAVYLSTLSQKKPAGGGKDGGEGDPAQGEEMSAGDSVFHGHYGYILKLPPNYKAQSTFRDAQKTHEVAYIYPKGTDATHFIHEGLYGAMGILRLEVTPRRVPQGFVGMNTIKGYVTAKLTQKKAVFNTRDMVVHAMPAFIVHVEKPFKYARAHIVGEKVHYTLTGGSENDLFKGVLQSLSEVAPHERPGD